MQLLIYGKQSITRQFWLVMKLIIFFMIIGLTQISAKSNSQNISFSGENVSLKKVFSVIKKQSGYVFFYDEDLIRSSKPVTLNVKNAPVEKVLLETFRNQPLTWLIENKTITILKKENSEILKAKAKEILVPAIDVRGKVIDENGNNLEKVTVMVKGTSNGTATNEKGEYRLTGIDEDAVLIFSIVGYRPKEVRINSRTEINVTLNLDIIGEEEIVISTGYQTISKERATGSYSVVTEKDLSGKMQTSILSRLEGMVAGFTSYKGANRIRGTATISGTTSPLYVVDGFPFEGSLSAINPSDIESVTFLKDATAASIYGARSANGVIVIETKKGLTDKTVIEYNNSFRVVPLPDHRDYLNLMNSRELVDFQVDMFNYFHTPYNNLDPKLYINEVRDLLYQNERGNISDAEMNAQLDVYRNTDNRQQLIDHFLRKSSLTHQHNLSLRGGAGKYQYAASANYLESLPNEKAQKNSRIGYNVKNTYQFFDWLRVDFGLMGSITNNDYNNGFSGGGNLHGGKSSYINLIDDDGSQIPWYRQKSQEEIDRLISLGLYDETFYPLEELNKERYTSKSNYLNAKFGLNFQITKDLNFDFKYQLENTHSYIKNLRDKDSYLQKTTINNATSIDHNNNTIRNYIPQGGYINERRSDAPAYTVRGQLNFNRDFGQKHSVTAIAGAERRAIKNKFTFLEKWGYDNTSLAHKYIDEVILSSVVQGTQSLNGTYVHYPGNYPVSFGETENRFVAFYGNASYEFDRKYIVSGSIRMDQSNLFGSDPKLQYKPLWSVGANWKLHKEDFLKNVHWLNTLSLRATYGINGNIAKQSGPYLIVADAGVNSWTQEYSSNITSPPNSGLTWEKTYQTNFGVDFGIFNNRLTGSFEYYNKRTSDLLGPTTVDPTSGWNSLTLNYASMYNKGFEINLNSRNIETRNFRWGTSFNFSANTNKVTNIENSNNSVAGHLSGTNTRVGLALGSLYSIRWAGLNNLGRPQSYQEDGKTVVSSLADITLDDLIYSGTVVPKFSAGLSNRFNYKDFNLSFMFIFYGGHVMRDVMPSYITSTEGYSTNINKNILNYWKNPGDEKDPDKSPAILRNASANFTTLWYSADMHLLKADYIKLREITFGYNVPKSLTRKIGSPAIMINAQIENLWYWANNNKGLDPESWDGTTSASSRSPLTPKTYTLGLSITL